jgi:hypothetical protein
MLRLLAILWLLVPVPALAWSWTYLSMDGKTATTIVCDPIHDRVFAGTVEGFHYLDQTTGVWTSRDWEGWIGRTVHSIDWDRQLDERVITGRENAFFKGYIEVSDDLGATQHTVYDSNGGGVSDLAHDDFWNYACTWPDVAPGEFLRSTDHGDSWTLLTGTGQFAMTSIALGHDGVVYLGGDGLVTRSFDQGGTWESAAGNLPGGYGIYCLVAYPPGETMPPGHLFASNDLGLYETFDRGDHWQPILDSSCRNIAVYPQNIGLLAVATFDGRVLVSRNGGGEWTDETGDLPGAPVDLVFSLYDRSLYVATAQDGVYRSDPVVSGVAASLPGEDDLVLRAEPNPFRVRTRLRLDLPRAGEVEIGVYDLGGRRAASLFRGRRRAGIQFLDWDAGDLPAGEYLVRLHTPWGTRSTRLLLLR